MIIASLLACFGGPSQDDSPSQDSVADTDSERVDTGPVDTGPVDTGPVDTGTGTPRDQDQDGFTEDVDCDDLDPLVFPGAQESFDGVDNDCDGVVDAVGHFSGVLSLSATAWFEGERHDFELQCPAEMERGLVDYELEVVCSTDADDSWGRLLLGETLTVRPEDPYLWELEQWSGAVVFESSNGWDTLGQGTVRWKDMHTAKITVALDTRYLDISGSGTVLR